VLTRIDSAAVDALEADLPSGIDVAFPMRDRVARHRGTGIADE
jgi:hypothetical protein